MQVSETGRDRLFSTHSTTAMDPSRLSRSPGPRPNPARPQQILQRLRSLPINGCAHVCRELRRGSRGVAFRAVYGVC
jgi:hypothetical protein